MTTITPTFYRTFNVIGNELGLVSKDYTDVFMDRNVKEGDEYVVYSDCKYNYAGKYVRVQILNTQVSGEMQIVHIPIIAVFNLPNGNYQQYPINRYYYHVKQVDSIDKVGQGDFIYVNDVNNVNEKCVYKIIENKHEINNSVTLENCPKIENCHKRESIVLNTNTWKKYRPVIDNAFNGLGKIKNWIQNQTAGRTPNRRRKTLQKYNIKRKRGHNTRKYYTGRKK